VLGAGDRFPHAQHAPQQPLGFSGTALHLVEVRQIFEADQDTRIGEWELFGFLQLGFKQAAGFLPLGALGALCASARNDSQAPVWAAAANGSSAKITKALRNITYTPGKPYYDSENQQFVPDYIRFPRWHVL
jgi:hypothetical protein